MTIWLWMLLLLSFGTHELGHWLAYKYFGHNAKLKLKWWGIQIGENVMLDLTPNQSIVVGYAGIIAGAWIMFFPIPFIKAFYPCSCVIDLLNIWACTAIPKKWQSKPIIVGLQQNMRADEWRYLGIRKIC